jgi:hypothetical protein
VFSRAWPAVDELRALFGATRVWALAPWWQADER